MVIAQTTLKPDVVGLEFVRDVIEFTVGVGVDEQRVTLSTFRRIDTDCEEIQLFTVVYPSGETAVFEVLYDFIYSESDFPDFYENGDIDAVDLGRGCYAVLQTIYNCATGKIDWYIDDVLDFAFGRNTEIANVYNYILEE